MPCDSSVVNEQGDTFSIEGPYVLNCNESRTFNYIDKVTLWTDGICSGTKNIQTSQVIYLSKIIQRQ
jgi:hypothetical protein